jgi:hypothetical protein
MSSKVVEGSLSQDTTAVASVDASIAASLFCLFSRQYLMEVAMH